MNAWTFYLNLHSPLLITGVGGGDPNSEVCLSYIPGSSIRGALIGRYEGPKDVVDVAFRHLFLDGGVRYLNAYPTLRGRRMLPTPLSLQQVKDAKGGSPIHDFAVYSDGADNRTWKSLNEEYCWFSNEESTLLGDPLDIYLAQPGRDVNIHIARENRQRPTDAGSTVFRYDSLTSGQTFCAVILSEKEEDLYALGKMIAHGARFAMGRSNSAEYGQVEVQWSVDNNDDNPEQDIRIVGDEWREAPGGEAANGQLSVSLLSDALVCDPETGAFTDSLTSIVGTAHASAYVRTRTVGGFNRKWNLPIPQATAIAAGSVFVYEDTPDLRKRLEKLAEDGLGQRVVEGFGRIAIDWQSTAELREKTLSPSMQGVADVLNEESLVLAGRMAERLLRRHLDQQLLVEVNRADLSGMAPVQKNQLATLRTLVRQDLQQAVEDRLAHVESKAEMVHLKQYLGKLRNVRRDQLQRARLNGVPFLSWLEQLAAKPGKTIQPRLGYSEDNAVIIGTVRARMSRADDIEYSARLIDAICRRAIKQSQQGEST